MSTPTDHSTEWSSAPEATDTTRRRLRLALLLLGLTGAGVAGLMIYKPPVEASIETDLPPGPIALTGNVTLKPTRATLGTLGLSWMPSSRDRADPIGRQTILLELHLSRPDCARLAQIGGTCGSTGRPAPKELESLRLEASEPSLYATVTAPKSPRSELEPQSPATHRGAPVEWTLRSYAPSIGIHLSCAPSTAVTITAAPISRRSPAPFRTVTCEPTGVRYRTRILDRGPIVTTVTFNRVEEFQSSGGADDGQVAIEKGTLSVDGDSGPIDEPATVALHPSSGSTVSLHVVSPTADTSAAVELSAAQASHVQVDGSERTSSELGRIAEWPWGSVLLSWVLFLIGTTARLTYKLRPWRRNDAKK